MPAPRQHHILFTLLTLSLLLPAFAFSKDNTTPQGSSAYEFVQEWLKTYAIDHKRAASMMTKTHRSGMSEDAWVEMYAPYIDYVKYRHLGGKLISIEEEDLKTKITLKSSVDSIKGPVVQYEIYHLLEVDGSWLIDYIDIRDENFESAIGPEPVKKFDPKKKQASPK